MVLMGSDMVNVVLRSYFIPKPLYSEFRRVAFERGVSESALVRLFFEFGRDFLEDRDRTVSGLGDLKSDLDGFLVARKGL